MNEMEMNGEVHHIAKACDLESSIHIVPKGSLAPITRKRILDSLTESPKQVVATVPTIYVPNPQSCDTFYKHAGDSFREMIDLWEERGFVKKEYADCKNVWMNSVGDVLLYDRPNYDWLKRADGNEQTWKKALFGNPKPIGANAKAWSFWGRRPRLIEAMLDQPVEKTRNLVFYGKIENSVQRANRTKHDWASVCDKYYMAKEDEVPLLSEQKYLDSISKAKYGLCLAGYGKKCHREVECMAFGTVPVCAPEVDMESYANPPVVGTHYLRVQNPEDAKTQISNLSEEQWLAMSTACKEWYKTNCSVDGMWGLTKRLLE
jgi:hypothetical protein